MLALLAWIPEMATWLPEVYSETDMFARIPNYVLTTGAIVAVIVLVGLYDNQRAPVADGSVGLVVGVPANQLMTQSGDDIVLPVVLRLINRSEKEEALEAENKCKIFRFVVTTPQNEFIQAKRFADDCPTNTAYGICEANSVIEQIEAVRLDASRYARRLQIAGQVLEL